MPTIGKAHAHGRHVLAGTHPARPLCFARPPCPSNLRSSMAGFFFKYRIPSYHVQTETFCSDRFLPDSADTQVRTLVEFKAISLTSQTNKILRQVRRSIMATSLHGRTLHHTLKPSKNVNPTGFLFFFFSPAHHVSRVACCVLRENVDPTGFVFFFPTLK